MNQLTVPIGTLVYWLIGSLIYWGARIRTSVHRSKVWCATTAPRPTDDSYFSIGEQISQIGDGVIGQLVCADAGFAIE